MTNNPLLKVGPHDSTNAARGGALFAMRMAAVEIVVDKQQFWCCLVSLFETGFWRRGLTKSSEILVF
jgi:hypothetical protein